MILFLFTIMLMNLNKENEFINPELQDWVFFCLITVVFFGFHQLKPYHWRIHKYWRGLSIYKSIG
jgi:NADH:ubiquinone oxidoreductase subunit 6 (subunit J)